MAESNGVPDKKLAPREYQLELLEAAKKRNIIICLGTGTGKTFISIKFIEYLAQKDDICRPFSEGAKRTFFLVNSVPLVTQQALAIEQNTGLKVAGFCGEMGVDFWGKNDWLKQFENNHVLVMTHQIYLDLIQHARHGFSLSQANLLVFDECHHANKNHPFKKIMDCFGDVRNKQNLPRILGLTASVVGRKVKPFQIGDEIKRLECTMRSVCRTASDPDVVEKYGAKPEEIMKIYSSSNELDAVAMYLEYEFSLVLLPLEQFLDNIKILKDARGSQDIIKKELDIAKSAVRDCKSALEEIGIWAAHQVALMLVEDLEKHVKKVTIGLSSNTKIASLLIETTITSLQEIGLKYKEFNKANQDGLEKIQLEYLKPKVKKLLKLFTQTKDDQSEVLAIVFVRRRFTACVLSKLINTLASTSGEYDHLKADYVTGHGSEVWGLAETEMDFKKQNEKLKNFRKGEINVLVGTSVVEEGVDIPKCNLVVMFDFPQNFRAFVQSRGRGRAKGAKYVMLVSKDEFPKHRQDQLMYQGVDEHLKRFCQTERDGPTEEEINEAINVYPLPNYYTDKNAKLDMGNCVSRLFRYCSKLPCDRFTSLKPVFTTHDVDGEFRCTLKMPGNSHITGVIQGETMPSKKEARQAAAFEACMMLHQLDALDDHLLPVESSSESEESDGDEVDGRSQPKTGTKKRRRSHPVKVSKQLYGKLTTDGTEQVYIYAINMAFDPVYKQVKKDLWDRKDTSLGIVTSEKLPSEELRPLSFYNEIGKLTVTLAFCGSIRVLTSTQQNLVNWFHHFIFTDTLKFNVSSLTRDGCRVVLLNDGHTGLSSSTQTAGINFEEMEKLKRNVSTHDGTFSTDIDLMDSVVVEGYLRTEKHADPGHYLVITTRRNATESKVEAIHHTRKIDCRRSKDVIRSKSRILLRNPQALEYRSSPMSLTLRALFVPVILYRVDSLVSMHELQQSVSMEDISPYVIAPESPAKRSRASSSQVPSPETFTTLPEYFSPFNSSKMVPLLRLLEAVTCTSSVDEFNLERLETLGDSFLKMAVSIHVYWHKNHKDEGKLTKYRTRQISNKNLFKLAEKHNLTGYIKYCTFHKGTWLPPGFTPPSSVQNGGLAHFSDTDIDDVMDVYVDDVVKQIIPDKSVADSMEALIGAYFVHCGYIGALRFMKWLGVDAFHDRSSESESNEFTEGNRRKSPTPHDPSKYANYPMPSIKIPQGEEKAQYEDILARQTRELASFEKKIKYTFKNKVLLLEAFTHPTFSDNTITGSYQRLEFLGDAILDFLVTQHIYNNCKKDLKPGELTDLRSALVNNNIFAVIAIQNKYHRYLKEYSPVLFDTIRKFVQGVEEFHKDLGTTVIPDPYVIPVQSDSNDMECMEAPKPLGDVFESVAGAIFLDSGLDVSEVWRICYPMLEKYINEYSKNVPRNPVRIIKEEEQKSEFSSATCLEDGRISCILTFNGQQYKGVGRNKHNAKLSACHKALKSTKESN